MFWNCSYKMQSVNIVKGKEHSAESKGQTCYAEVSEYRGARETEYVFTVYKCHLETCSAEDT
jgi:hypothetical protein